MTGWRLQPGAYVVQVVFEDEHGRVTIGATANRPVDARRRLRRLERKYPDGPPRPDPAERAGRGYRLSPVQRKTILELAKPARIIGWDGETPGYLFPGNYKIQTSTMRALSERGLIYAVTDTDEWGIRDYQLSPAGREEAVLCGAA